MIGIANLNFRVNNPWVISNYSDLLDSRENLGGSLSNASTEFKLIKPLKNSNKPYEVLKLNSSLEHFSRKKKP